MHKTVSIPTGRDPFTLVTAMAVAADLHRLSSPSHTAVCDSTVALPLRAEMWFILLSVGVLRLYLL